METFNYRFNIIEMAIWAAIAVIVLVARFRRQKWRSFNLPLAITFLVFSWSDYIEANIGSFWESLWLFAIKAACVLSMAYHFVKYYIENLSQNVVDAASSRIQVAARCRFYDHRGGFWDKH